MALSSQNQQIITAYDELGMSPEDIAEQFEFELVAVKATLMQYSSKYREASKRVVDLKFDESQQEQAKNAIIRIMQNSEDEYLVLRAAKYIRDDAEGRLDNPLKGLKSLGVSILEFNERLLEARQAKARSASQQTGRQILIEDKSISVETSVEKVGAE